MYSLYMQGKGVFGIGYTHQIKVYRRYLVGKYPTATPGKVAAYGLNALPLRV